MNLSWFFSYGNLLKTFLPGLILMTGGVLLIDAYSFCVTPHHACWLILKSAKHPVAAISVFASASVFLGILSNSVHFLWTIPYMERGFAKRNAPFVAFKTEMHAQMRKHYLFLLQAPASVEDTGFDVRSFLLNRTDPAALQHLKESYWYYLEFQLNSMGALVVLLPAVILHLLLRLHFGLLPLAHVLPMLVGIVAFAAFSAFVLCKAAKANFEKHEKKFLSFLLGTYHVCRYGKVPTTSAVSATRSAG